MVGLGVTTAEKDGTKDAREEGEKSPTQEQQHVRSLQVRVSWLFSVKSQAEELRTVGTIYRETSLHRGGC